MSLLSGPGYPISRSSGRCAASGREFAVGERFVAAMVEREGVEELERLDFSVEAWEGGARPAAPLRLFAHWRAVMAAPGAKKSEFLGDDELMELFERLAEATEARRLAFRYMLALVLVRKRLLKYEGTRDGVMKVRPKPAVSGGPEASLIEVKDPGLTEDVLAGAMEQLGEIMTLDGSSTPAQAPAQSSARGPA